MNKNEEKISHWLNVIAPRLIEDFSNFLDFDSADDFYEYKKCFLRNLSQLFTEHFLLTLDPEERREELEDVCREILKNLTEIEEDPLYQSLSELRNLLKKFPTDLGELENDDE